MARKSRETKIYKLTENRGELKPKLCVFEGIARFSATYKFCYFNNETLEKVKGGIGHGRYGNYGSGGNYVGVEDGESYLVDYQKQK